MSVLSSDLRSVLERGVGEGRSAAETAAISALGRLGVAAATAPSYLTADEISLREGLLARASQLGDPRSGGSVEVAVPLLVGEVAYEQWHRLLFARFLAENGLLMHPQFGAPVSLAECEELAPVLGEPDGWAVAARFASEILPGIFRLDDPAVLVGLAPEDRLALEKIVTGLPAEIFTADDALGWVYQYWQSKQKKLVNDSGRKIGGADISPVTQLFTEDYMVRFLLENSLGAWWASRYPHSPLIAGWDYLRFDENDSPAAGSFDNWPSTIDQVTVMDPCCGSGHFLVAAFGMLWRMRAEAEGLAPADAQDAVLRENLFGLELDPRCTQIAMFNLALEAWKQGGYRELPVPNVACSGVPAKAPLSEWTVLADGDVRLEAVLTRLHELFKDADTLGSLIDPRRAAEQDDLFSVDWDTVAPLLEQALAKEVSNPAITVFRHAAAGIAHAADLLSRKYSLIATNPPYLGAAKQVPLLQAASQALTAHGSVDLSTTVLQRWRSSLATIIVLPDGWRFIPSFRKFRDEILETWVPRVFAGLGPRAFRAILFDYPIGLFILERRAVPSAGEWFARVEGAVTPATAGTLATIPLQQTVASPAGLSGAAYVGDKLSEYVTTYEGLSTGDGPRFIRKMWETMSPHWTRFQIRAETTKPWAGTDEIVYWKGDGADLIANPAARIQGLMAVGRKGILVERQRPLHATLFAGTPFFKTAVAVIPNNEQDLAAIWTFTSSDEYRELVRARDPRVGLATSAISDVPFDVEYWRARTAELLPGGLPEPFSADPTQWLFDGVVVESSEPLQVAIGRLVGFSWRDQGPDELDALADEDGIVCLPPIAGEASAAERLRGLLAVAYGPEWSTVKLDELLAEAGAGSADLEGWLRESFFRQHAKLFQSRPFIWHIWDGRADGFSALVNYHRLDRRTLEKLTYTTLGWWIQKQKDDAADDEPGAAARLAAADQLKSKLELILEGEPPLDVFVRWKSLAEQPIGWDPDLDDGVRMNIRPFVEAGILRAKFTINWNKDRGTNPDGSDRLNDLHYTNAEKHQARGGAD